MKKKMFAILLMLGALLCPSHIQAKSVACDHWYIRHTGNHTPPVCDTRFSYLDNYSAYYIDHESAENSASPKKIYLTFDAGYENGNIEKILDILKEEQVPAAFFILRHLVDRNLPLITRMVEEGHLVCNHTAKHKDMSKADKASFTAELTAMENIYRDATGKEISKFYRPPEGKFVEENLAWAQELGYSTILWSFAYPDWDNNKQPDPEKSKLKLLENAHPGEILLLHPTSKTNTMILKDVIQYLKNEGYQFSDLNALTKPNTENSSHE